MPRWNRRAIKKRAEPPPRGPYGKPSRRRPCSGTTMEAPRHLQLSSQGRPNGRAIFVCGWDATAGLGPRARRTPRGRPEVFPPCGWTSGQGGGPSAFEAPRPSVHRRSSDESDPLLILSRGPQGRNSAVTNKPLLVESLSNQPTREPYGSPEGLTLLTY